MLQVAYSGTGSDLPRNYCRAAHLNHGEGWFISFGRLKPDRGCSRDPQSGWKQCNRGRIGGGRTNR
jgi:hypothetical protein